MNKNLFAELLESVEQAGEIIRGERVASREFNVDAVEIKKDPEHVMRALAV